MLSSNPVFGAISPAVREAAATIRFGLLAI